MISIKKILPKAFIRFMIEHRYMFKEMKKRHKKYLKQLLIENSEKSLSIDDEKKWLDKLNRLTYSYPELIEVGEAFASSQISVLQDIEVKDSDVIAICVEKNDIIKLKKFIMHHRKLGIDKFVILDNCSTDGTIEWLLTQNDVVLLQTQIPYNTNRREGWINRIIAHYGCNRWYFIADSDELLFYNNCENKTIKDLIEYYKNLRIVRARAIMIDMYSNPEYYYNGNKEDYYEECIYFDKDTYYECKRDYLDLVCGGPRERVFGETPWLTKYPLFYFRNKDIECKSHFFFPFKENIDTECQLVLKHYKFQPGELEKYKDIVKKGNYYKGSKQYRQYVNVMEDNKKLNFICKSTTKYIDSHSLDKITIYKKINWSYKGESNGKQFINKA